MRRKILKKTITEFQQMISFERICRGCSCNFSYYLNKFTSDKLLTPLPNVGTESACSPRPAGRRGPQLEPMLKQTLIFDLEDKKKLVSLNLCII
jgi:hypothetical protein